MTTSTRIGLVFAIFSTVIYAPSVRSYIIRSSKKRSPNQLMTLQGLDAESELRILLCIHGPVHLPTAINFIEISQGRDDPRIMVYVTDMIELTGQIKSTRVKREGEDVVTVTDRAVVEMRHQITTAIKAYEEQNESVVTLPRILALSPFPVMHQDICSFAGELHVSLIVLPLHKYQAAGKNTGADSKFRSVNKRARSFSQLIIYLEFRNFKFLIMVSNRFFRMPHAQWGYWWTGVSECRPKKYQEHPYFYTQLSYLYRWER